MPSQCFGSTEEFLRHWSDDMPGCLVLDVRLPGMTGVEFQGKLAHSGVNIPIIFMTAHGDIPMVRKVMKAGAIEFLTKPFQQDELLHAIEQALEFDRSRRHARRSAQSIQDRFALLTPREREIVSFLRQGMRNRQIAGKMGITEGTVKIYLFRLDVTLHDSAHAEFERPEHQLLGKRVRPQHYRAVGHAAVQFVEI